MVEEAVMTRCGKEQESEVGIAQSAGTSPGDEVEEGKGVDGSPNVIANVDDAAHPRVPIATQSARAFTPSDALPVSELRAVYSGTEICTLFCGRTWPTPRRLCYSTSACHWILPNAPCLVPFYLPVKVVPRKW